MQDRVKMDDNRESLIIIRNVYLVDHRLTFVFLPHWAPLAPS